MKAIKNNLVSVILNALVFIVALVATIMYASNKGLGYFTGAEVSAAILPCAIIAIILSAIVLAVDFTPVANNKYVVICKDVLMMAIGALLIVSALYFVKDRVDYYGYALFSDLESGNPAAVSGCKNAIAGQVVFVIGALLSCVSCFIVKEPKAE